jgi:hypothetical protein
MAWQHEHQKGPHGYSRTGLRIAAVRAALSDGEWRSLSWLVAELSDAITPEAAIRYLRASKYSAKHKLQSELVSKGKAKIIESFLKFNTRQYKKRGAPQLEMRKGERGLDFRLIRDDLDNAKQDDTAQENPPGRQHATPRGTRQRTNP